MQFPFSKRLIAQLTIVAAFVLVTGGATAVPISQLNDRSIPIPSTSDQHELSLLMQKAIALLREKNIVEAEKVFKQAVQKFPKNYRPLLGLAEVARRNRDLMALKGSLDRATTLAPNEPNVLVAQGRFQILSRKPALAKASYIKALSIGPNTFYANLDLADLQMTAFNDARAALPLYRKAIALRDSHAGAHYGLGMALIITGDTSPGIDQLQAAEKLAPTNPLPAQSLARLYFNQGRYDQAMAKYKQLLKKNPKYLPALAGTGDVLARTGKLAQAAKAYESAISVAPKYGPARLKLAMINQQSGDVKSAANHYRLLIQQHPKDPVAYNNLAWILLAEKRYKTALKLAEKSVELSPRAVMFKDTLAWIHRAVGNLDLAHSMLKSAASETAPPVIWYHLGVVEMELGNRDAALGALNRAVNHRAEFAEVTEARQLIAKLQRQ